MALASWWRRELECGASDSGNKVYAYKFGNPHGGFYAEFAVADANHVGRVPKALDLRDAGAVAAAA